MTHQKLKAFVLENSDKTAQQIFDLLPQATHTIGHIYDKLDLLTLVLAHNLDDQLQEFIDLTDDEITEITGNTAYITTYRSTAKSLKKALDPQLIISDNYTINLAVSDVMSLLEGAAYFGLITSGENSSQQLEKIIALATETVDEFSGISIDDVTNYHNAYLTLTTKDIEWNNERYLRITLHDDLFEPSNVVTFFSNNIFTKENLGKSKRLDKAGVYIIDLTNVRKSATLHVNFNISANATCELIA